MKKPLCVIALVLAHWATFPAPAEAGFQGPYPYSNFGDSPFVSAPLTWFYLEDFEDGALNTPGVTVDNGIVVRNALTVDSVDSDDGAVDGLSNTGASLTSVAGPDGVNSFTFTFQPNVLGRYPSHVAIVFTDGTPNGWFTFEPFDNNGFSLGTLGAFVGDDSFTGQTGEDTFYGAAHEEGISRFIVSDNGNPFDVEIDHLQYGAVVPEPSSWALAATALGATGLAARRRRKRSQGLGARG